MRIRTRCPLPAPIYSSLLIGKVKGDFGEYIHVDSTGKAIVTEKQKVFRIVSLPSVIVNKTVTEACTQSQWLFRSIERLTLGCIKLSIVLWYRRIFVGKWFNIWSWIIGVTVVAWTTSFFIPTVFSCRPIQLMYTGTMRQYFSHCIDTATLQNSYAITDLLTDVIILSMPVPMIWRLQMSTKRKISVSGIFFLGIL